jgi:hypothetical protein
MSNSIVLMGGLGNQMFQIYTLIAHSLRNGKPFIFPDCIDGPRQKTYWDTLFRNLRPFVVAPNFSIVHYVEDVYHYVPLPLSSKEQLIYGYFQSWKYFQDQIQIINELLDISKSRAEVEAKCITELDIAMHFRVGDYKLAPEHHPIQKLEYYMDSLSHILAMAGSGLEHRNVVYFYELEDQDHVLGYIGRLGELFPEVKFIPAPSGLEDYEQLLAMSLAKHNIIANSSFSWWGAYLNPNPNKIVCYPSVWFGPGFPNNDTRDLCPTDWKAI